MRGNPRAAYQKRVINKSAEFEAKPRRTKSSIAEDANKELDSLAYYIPDLSDTDTHIEKLAVKRITRYSVIA